MDKTIHITLGERNDRCNTERAQECLDRGLVLSMFGNRADAIRFYRKALLLDPDNAIGHYMLGVALMKRGDTDDAVHEWRATADTNRPGTQARWARRQAQKLLQDYARQ